MNFSISSHVRRLASHLALLSACCAGLLAAQGPAGEQEPRKAGDPAPRKNQFPAYAPIVEQEGLPRVLILGDSISIGYMLPVRARLAGKANVLRPSENCADTGTGLRKVENWLAMGSGRWDVIHFNFGLHDVKYLDAKGKYVTPDKGTQVSSVQVYERNLRALVQRMKKTGAKLILTTTTQVPASSSGRVEHDELRYNEVAKKIAAEEGIAVDDLHAVVAPIQAKIQLPKNVHFTEAGYERLADAVAESIARALPAKAR